MWIKAWTTQTIYLIFVPSKHCHAAHCEVFLVVHLILGLVGSCSFCHQPVECLCVCEWDMAIYWFQGHHKICETLKKEKIDSHLQMWNARSHLPNQGLDSSVHRALNPTVSKDDLGDEVTFRYLTKEDVRAASKPVERCSKHLPFKPQSNFTTNLYRNGYN